jgi:hypothetical protein
VVPEGAVEDALSLLRVQLDQLAGVVLRPALVVLGRLDQAEREDAAGRGPGDQVEELGDAGVGSVLDLGQDRRGNDAADSAPSIDRTLRMSDMGAPSARMVEPDGAAGLRRLRSSSYDRTFPQSSA